MHNSIKKNVSGELNLVDEKIKFYLKSNPTNLDKYFSDFLFNDAKRLRPLFIFLVCKLLNLKIDDEIINFAAGIEFLHSASLIHDDILDNGKTRRNLACIHLDKDVKTAVLAGDYLLSLAIESFCKINNINLFKIMAKTSYTMTKSEIEALDNRFKTPTVEEYIELSKNKTSILFLACVQGIEEIKKIKVDENLLKFTENFSLCFQIKDDINNFLKLEKNKTSNDKESGIYTLPVILGTIDKTGIFLDDLIRDTEALLEVYQNKKELILLLNLFKKG